MKSGARPPSALAQRQWPVLSSGSLSRPSSRASQRPGSRLSRPATRQTSRILPQCQTLLTQVTGLTPQDDDERYRAALDVVVRSLEHTTKAAVGVDMAVMDRQIHGHAQKARIYSRDAIASALEASYQRLKSQFKQSDLDQDIKMSHLPDHLQLLILLSLPPSQSTTTYAEIYLDNMHNPANPISALTWKQILAEEPFSGQHWEGAYGLPPGSTVEQWETRSGGSTPSLSPLDDSDEDEEERDEEDFFPEANHAHLPSTVPPSMPMGNRHHPDSLEPYNFDYRTQVEDLQARQYWRAEWRTDASLARHFNLGDPSTLGPSLSKVLGGKATLSIAGPELERYINECDAVREVLMLLQGCENILMSWTAETQSFELRPSAPRLVHLTLGSFTSILSSFSATATVLEHLRKFVACVFTTASRPHPRSDVGPAFCFSRTMEAFSDAVNEEITAFNIWCSTREAKIAQAQAGIGSPVIVSLLSLESDLRGIFSESMAAVLHILRTVLAQTTRSRDTDKEVWLLASLPTKVPPAAVTCVLLDTLFQSVQTYLSMADTTTSNALMRVFVKTAEPVWCMIGRWLQDGMPVRDPGGRWESHGDVALDEEFFIEDNEMTLLDTEFWADGYTLRGETDEDEGRPKTIPIFLTPAAGHVLGSGKAIGLLRALGIVPRPGDNANKPSWPSFKSVLACDTIGNGSSASPSHTLQTDTLIRVVYDELLPHCQATGAVIADVLVEDCGLWEHLSSIEDLFLMRRGDTISRFADIIFAKLDNQQHWSDFHFLNSAFVDTVESERTNWIRPSLVRLAYRGNKDRAINRTVRGFDGLIVDYAVPFPLTYIFTPRVLQVYNSVFVFLLQVRRAKSVLERILVRDVITIASQPRTEMKAFYAMRSRLAWFVNTLLNFLTTYVIHTQLLRFHASLRDAKSLDEMIQIHGAYLERIHGRCLLQSKTSPLHRATLSILDICLHFGDFFVAFAGDTTHNVTRSSMTMRRHRSHAQRRQRYNVVGFAQPPLGLRDSASEDESTDEDEDEGARFERDAAEPSSSFMVSSTFMTDDAPPFDRLDKMSKELDGLVRFLRRGVESLAGGTGDAAQAFGVLAFALEDWDT